MSDHSEQSLLRLERILDATTEGFWEWNIETSRTYYSPAWHKMLGLAQDDLLR
jgi:PAS domain-containing protein